jgi:hypothetical protein
MAAPSIHWWHMPQDLSQSDGMRRTRAVLASMAKGQISGDEDTLHLRTTEFHAIVNCIRRGDGIFTIMIVASNDDRQAKAIMEEIRTGMQSGLID